MQLTVTGRHMDVGQSLRSHVEDGLEIAVAKYFDKAMEANVVFSKAGAFVHADISVHVGRNIVVMGQGEAEDPYVAFNTAADHIAKRLRRYKRRLRDHHHSQARDIERIEAQQYILADDAESDTDVATETGTEPTVVAEMTTEIEMLTVSEAVMRMDLAGSSALMFRNSAHGGLNMIYRRSDGNIGWVDPQGLAVPVSA